MLFLLWQGSRKFEDAIKAFKKDFTLPEDRKGDLYYGITLAWEYKQQTLDISMQGYI